MADSDRDEDDWEIVWIEGRLDLGKGDGSEIFINYDCDKYDDDNWWWLWWLWWKYVVQRFDNGFR